ncbi:MAG TPA: TetR/AcrR family transcriptional regulator [Jatrophihabitantaceae bacterium]|nr:TetR/AcrR family transcriptional regulator [Jatrophihabitantaceae bacterium]
MSTEKRIRLNPEARRAQLIELGVEMLGSRTLDDLSVEDIAQEAGISRGLLFHYFSSKREFHVEVARAVAQELLRRTEPDTSKALLEALHGSLHSFIDFVEENPDSYKTLVRGAASGDAEMRAIFDETRSTLAQRVVATIGDLGLQMSPKTELAVNGWVAFVEECVIRWIETRPFDRDVLQDLLAKSLPAVALASTDEEVGTLVSILTAETAISAG